MSDVPLTPAELALEQTGLEFLRIGKFRKARDAFKSLHKSQPSRAVPLLIDANMALAHEMMTHAAVLMPKKHSNMHLNTIQTTSALCRGSAPG